jgi:hypothetical protein
MIAVLVYIGLYPAPIFHVANPALSQLQRVVEQLGMPGR